MVGHLAGSQGTGVRFSIGPHLSTLTNFLFLTKIKLKDLILKIIKPIDFILKKINENFFGKIIVAENNNWKVEIRGDSSAIPEI